MIHRHANFYQIRTSHYAVQNRRPKKGTCCVTSHTNRQDLPTENSALSTSAVFPSGHIPHITPSRLECDVQKSNISFYLPCSIYWVTGGSLCISVITYMLNNCSLKHLMLVVEVLPPRNIYGHTTMGTDLRLCNHGNIIVLPHWEIRLLATWPDIPLSQIILVLS